MSVSPERLRQMEREVASFHIATEDRDQNHRRYLAEAAQYLRGVTDPLDVLRFLDALRASPFARRPQQKVAVADVGAWLGGRLLREPGLPRDVVATELGWMQRLVVIHRAKLEADGAGVSHGAAAVQDGFRGLIEAIEKRRTAEAAAAAKARVREEAPKPPPRVAPSTLPESFAAEFVDATAARDARKKAREREKAGKPKKEAWLALQPTDTLLRELAKGLACTLDTEGCGAVFDEMTRRDGRPVVFTVTALRREGERLVVGRIALAAAG